MIDMLRIPEIMALLPELFLLYSTLLLLVHGVYRGQRASMPLVALGGFSLIVTALIASSPVGLVGTFHQGMFISNGFTVFAKWLILLSAALALLLANRFLQEEGGRPFEYVILLMMATLGLLLMVSAADFLALYMALELTSLALYVLASFTRDEAKSSEAGLKYFVLGALASGMLLFGISLIYGFTGTTNFDALATLLSAGEPVSKAVVVGLVLVLVAFCFKLSAAPFHMWTPDVYEGAPTPVAAFFATAPKVAALALFVRLLLGPFGDQVAQWQQIVIFVSILSMLVGALGAIAQTNIERLLAYSSIGHIGFMLIGLASASFAGVQAILIYLALYIFMSIGMFACVLAMRRDGAPLESIKDLAGLSRTHPALAIAISIFMFSMAGIPFLSGFFGKFYVVIAAVKADLAWLAVVGVAASVIGAYYYLKVVKTMYFDEPAAPFDAPVPSSVETAALLGAGVTFFYFLWPTPLVNVAARAAGALLK